MTTNPDIESRAAEWLALEDRGCADVERRALEAWLAESSAHRVAYLRLKTAWRRADRLAALRSLPTASAPANDPARATRRAWRGLEAAAAAVVAIGLGAFLFELGGFGAPEEYRTQLGGREVVPLADGSKVELNTDTRIRARVEDANRIVWLDRGEAFFDVAKDEDRPFVVMAGTHRITVLGTKFSVRRDDLDVQVKVLEGRVRVDAIDGNGEGSAKRPPTMLTGGQVAVARAESTLVVDRPVRDIGNELAWRGGMLVMNQWTLGEAAREFNRYNRRKLVVDASAEDIRLGGSFESGGVEAFARLLKDAYGLRVEADDDSIRISN